MIIGKINNISEKNHKIILQILLIIEIVLIIGQLLILYISPTATGYEISIYQMYPIFFWFFLIASIFLGVIILLFEIIYPSKFKIWIYG